MYLKFFSIWRKGPEGLDSWKNGCNNLVDTSCYETVPLNISQLFCWLEHDHYFYPRLLSVPYTLNSGVCTQKLPSRPGLRSPHLVQRWGGVSFSASDLRPSASEQPLGAGCSLTSCPETCAVLLLHIEEGYIQKKKQRSSLLFEGQFLFKFLPR